MSTDINTTQLLGRIDRVTRQRDEWQRIVTSKMENTLERSLRNLHDAAVLAAHAKGMQDTTAMFKYLIRRVSNWSDEECAHEFSENMADIDASIRMSIKSHATLMALTVAKPCSHVIKVPITQVLFRKVLMECALDHSPEVFATNDFAIRRELRCWIRECIIKHLISAVPVSLFTDDNCEEPSIRTEDLVRPVSVSDAPITTIAPVGAVITTPNPVSDTTPAEAHLAYAGPLSNTSTEVEADIVPSTPPVSDGTPSIGNTSSPENYRGLASGPDTPTEVEENVPLLPVDETVIESHENEDENEEEEDRDGNQEPEVEDQEEDLV